MKIKANAKTNLYLDVIRRREDGYHDIVTIYQSIDLSDSIVIEKSDGIWVDCNQLSLPGDMNLAYKAARLISDVVGLDEGVSITIEKSIPIGAGLGGGSADAAAVLVGMNQLFDLNLSQATLRELGAELGADVPFCIMGGTALGEGIGDQLTPMEFIGEFWFVIAKPEVDISTAWAYKSLELTQPRENGNILLEKFARADSADSIAQLFFNRFESVVFPEYPEISRLKSRMLELGASGAQMSGSGSAVLGVFSDKRSASIACHELRDESDFCVVTSSVEEGVVII